MGIRMDLTTAVGAAATLASTISFAPQAWKVIRTRDTAAISVQMYAITVVGFALWLTYGLLMSQWPLIVTNAICLALSSFILMMKLLPARRRAAVADALAGKAQRS
jgi:MtN3 and saliva related transmembrane protein